MFPRGENEYSEEGWAFGIDWPSNSSFVCFASQVKINSRGLVYSVVLLLGSVALTVSFSFKWEHPISFHPVQGGAHLYILFGKCIHLCQGDA